MNKVLITIIALFAVGCNFETEENQEQESIVCVASDTNYIKTHFDCKTYSVEYVFCDPSEDIDREDCIDPYDAPESFLTHCDSFNACDK